MDWLIDQQGSNWLFVGARPKKGTQFGKSPNLACGFPLHRTTEAYKARTRNNASMIVVGKIRLLGYHVRYSELGFNKASMGRKVIGKSVAREDILMIVDVLNKDFLGKSSASAKLSSLDKLRTFKLAVEKDEKAYAFDVLNLCLRCIKLLWKIQIHALAFAPKDFPRDTFTQPLSIDDVAGEMTHELAGERRHDQSVFPAAVKMLEKMTEEEGSVVLTKAKAWEEKMKVRHTAFKSEAEPSFENPYEIGMSLEGRKKFSVIVFQNADRGCRMPYGHLV
ncbi:hypothetical protein G6011_11501 [Alternaria panax]|uniref:Uncharacterized protein n=1 Tax=Alternaria panax TaxID=48097 RepID=A0AAD4IDV4_9PLEO|nr:hypothetical protein G6011_11501 [Alternaria panax]